MISMQGTIPKLIWFMLLEPSKFAETIRHDWFCRCWHSIKVGLYSINKSWQQVGTLTISGDTYNKGGHLK